MFLMRFLASSSLSHSLSGDELIFLDSTAQGLLNPGVRRKGERMFACK